MSSQIYVPFTVEREIVNKYILLENLQFPSGLTRAVGFDAEEVMRFGVREVDVTLMELDAVESGVLCEFRF